MKNILFVASESVPFIKTGGLADVIGSLPASFDKNEIDARVILPKYLCIPEKYRNEMTQVGSFYTYFNGKDRYVGIQYLEFNGVKFYFIDNEEYFGGDAPYGYPLWDMEKFGFFALAALSILPSIGFKPDIVHCHDWHTGLVPVYLKTKFSSDSFYHNIKSIMTIHNLRFQGLWGVNDIKKILDFPDELFTPDKLEFFGDVNYLKGGIVYADRVTTVSSTYSSEIKSEFYGERLENLLQARSNVLSGIVNGIDTESYNPFTDKALYKNFDFESFRTEKKKNKTDLQKKLGLTVSDKMFMVGIVSRLTDQKGFDLVERVFEEMLDENTQFVILGTGDARYENDFKYFASKYPDRVSANLKYSEDLSRQIYAASDAFLMPSLFEPCGLSQLIALRYGSLPVVRETGGLKDTVEPYNMYTGEGTGFTFANYNAHEMMGTLRGARDLYFNKKRVWNILVERAMKKDFSWTSSAKEYNNLYDNLISG